MECSLPPPSPFRCFWITNQDVDHRMHLLMVTSSAKNPQTAKNTPPPSELYRISRAEWIYLLYVKDYLVWFSFRLFFFPFKIQLLHGE